MSTVTTPKAQVPDIAGQITYAMRSMGVAPIPRNYSLFYEAYIGSNPALTRELAALGSKATQEELDALGDQYFDHNHGRIIETAHDKVRSELESLLSLLQHEQNSMENYSKLLVETVARISNKNITSNNIVGSVIKVLQDATGNTAAHGEKTAQSVSRHSEEMNQVRQELDEYKRIANTDSLTRLSNRRAFDEKLSSLFDSSIGLHLTSLVLLDIDHFKRINDTYGHPVGDKILATVGNLIRSNVRKDVFVARTGGEEFAIILEGNNVDEVMTICERIRLSLENTPFRNSRSGTDYGPVNISIGYAMGSQSSGPGELYAQSDTALYHAKETGRNRSVFFEEGMQKNYVGKNWLIYK
ncbi:GGDEF domain-containing protein [Agrobacterium sp.]|jgi:diguanylate cyclase|uniref:GGDEF domain-containing protein n=1 Tax=Agrobacterium sp. TaxID=361 RepID=UPI0028A66BF7